jgi:hypothetical protein
MKMELSKPIIPSTKSNLSLFIDMETFFRFKITMPLLNNGIRQPNNHQGKRLPTKKKNKKKDENT